MSKLATHTSGAHLSRLDFFRVQTEKSGDVDELCAHLAECGVCRERLARLDAMKRELMTDARVAGQVAGIMAKAGHPVATGERDGSLRWTRRRWWVPCIAATVVVAAAAVALLMCRPGGSASREPRAAAGALTVKHTDPPAADAPPRFQPRVMAEAKDAFLDERDGLAPLRRTTKKAKPVEGMARDAAMSPEGSRASKGSKTAKGAKTAKGIKTVKGSESPRFQPRVVGQEVFAVHGDHPLAPGADLVFDVLCTTYCHVTLVWLYETGPVRPVESDGVAPSWRLQPGQSARFPMRVVLGAAGSSERGVALFCRDRRDPAELVAALEARYPPDVGGRRNLAPEPGPAPAGCVLRTVLLPIHL